MPVQVGKSFDYDFPSRSQPNANSFNMRWDDLDRRLDQLEAFMPDWETQVSQLANTAVSRIDQVITPIATTLQQTAELGFLVAQSAEAHALHVGDTIIFTLTKNQQLALYNPSSFVVVERLATSAYYAICQTITYNKDAGTLTVIVLSLANNDTGSYSDWTITNAPGVSQAVRDVYNMTVAAQADVVARQTDIKTRQSDVVLRQQDVTSKQALASGNQSAAATSQAAAAASANAAAQYAAQVNPANYVKTDGTQPLTAVLKGVAPDASVNDNSLATASWVRARLAELVNGAQASLDTLKELADALGDDPNFAATMATALGNRLRIDAVQTFSDIQRNTLMQNVTAITALAASTVIASGATYTPDFSDGRLVKEITLSGNATIGAPANLPAGVTFYLIINQGGSGSYTLVWNASYKFGSAGTPVLSTAVGKRDLVSVIHRAAGDDISTFGKGY